MKTVRKFLHKRDRRRHARRLGPPIPPPSLSSLRAVYDAVRDKKGLQALVRVRDPRSTGYHVVAVIRGRVVLLDHPNDRADAFLRFVGGDKVTRCRCHDVRDHWRTMTWLPGDSRLHPAKAAAVEYADSPRDVAPQLLRLRKNCRPPAGAYRKVVAAGDTRRHKPWSKFDATTAPTDVAHLATPRPVEWPQPPGRRWDAGLKITLCRRLVEALVARLKAAGKTQTLRAECYSRVAASLVAWSTETDPEATLNLCVEVDPYSWFLRVFRVGAHRTPGYFVMAATRPTGRVAFAHAVPLARARRLVRDHVRVSGIPYTPGLLVATRRGWRFRPLPGHHSTTQGLYVPAGYNVPVPGFNV